MRLSTALIAALASLALAAPAPAPTPAPKGVDAEYLVKRTTLETIPEERVIVNDLQVLLRAALKTAY
ncbi:hypothetical protein CJU90_3044 [Yarrowia sp. C11]|nr:hypothetical protein CJU90_3044 [Yarrowia sp. C11]